MDEFKSVKKLHVDLINLTENLNSFNTMLQVYYHGMILNPDNDIWQDDPEKRIEILSNPYSMISDYITKTIDALNDINVQMAFSLYTKTSTDE